jgi:HAD superfamily hydrolase (TIGR01549 family)
MFGADAVIFDFIGTLTVIENYPYEGSIEKLFQSLVENGFDVDYTQFNKEYERAYYRNREIRYQRLIEIPNRVWVSEALNKLGHATAPDDSRIKLAINAFFEDYLKALKLREFAKTTLKNLPQKYKVGLVSNFTHAAVIYTGLEKLNINSYFDAVLVSEAFGWRKPSPKIFREALKRLGVEAEKTLFVGDTPLEDIQGAKDVGMKTVFIPSQFKNLDDMKKAARQPDYFIRSLNEVLSILNSHHTEPY